MNNSLNYNLSSEQNLLIDMLKTMYEDNIEQINSMTNSINNIRNANSQIRNLLMEIIIYSNNNTNVRNNNNTNTNNTNVRNNNNTSVRNNNINTSETQSTQRNLGRVILDNIPYVIENIQQYSIPLLPQQNENIQSNTTRNYLSTLAQNFLQPVQVYPTQSQIELATRSVRYCDILNPINRSCPISLELFNDNDMVSVIRFCGHIFKQEQLTSWFATNCRCPVCRYDIRNYNLNQPLNNTEPQIDLSNNNINEETNSTIPNRENTTIPNNNVINYLDILFDENLINDISNASDSTNENGLSRLFTSLQRRMS